MKKQGGTIKVTLFTSLIGIICSVLAFSATSYAFFVDSITSHQSRIESGNYYLLADFNGELHSGGETDEVALVAGVHEVVLTASGTAYTGFAIFDIDGELYYSEQVNSGEEITVYIECDSDIIIGYDYQWGYVQDGVNLVADGETIYW